ASPGGRTLFGGGYSAGAEGAGEDVLLAGKLVASLIEDVSRPARLLQAAGAAGAGEALRGGRRGRIQRRGECEFASADAVGRAVYRVRGVGQERFELVRRDRWSLRDDKRCRAADQRSCLRSPTAPEVPRGHRGAATELRVDERARVAQRGDVHARRRP